MNIRRYKPADRSAVVAIMNACGQHITEEAFDRDLDEPGERGRENSFVAIEDDQIVGDIRLAFEATEDGRQFRVYCFGEVHPDWRGHGVGRQLYRHIVDHVRHLARDEHISITLVQHVSAEKADQQKILQQTDLSPSVRIYRMTLQNLDAMPEVVWPV